MQNTDAVHTPPPKEKRIARGVRMEEELWRFVDGLAVMENGSASAVIERLVRERREAHAGVAA